MQVNLVALLTMLIFCRRQLTVPQLVLLAMLLKGENDIWLFIFSSLSSSEYPKCHSTAQEEFVPLLLPMDRIWLTLAVCVFGVAAAHQASTQPTKWNMYQASGFRNFPG
ncbi:hypothetical protein DER44DRAFT_126362 [Fusarium oxysporum]|nr:hypothetical protein DER44DRAFT_126362 [Fusarium oxysporum]